MQKKGMDKISIPFNISLKIIIQRSKEYHLS